MCGHKQTQGRPVCHVAVRGQSTPAALHRASSPSGVGSDGTQRSLHHCLRVGWPGRSGLRVPAFPLGVNEGAGRGAQADHCLHSFLQANSARACRGQSRRWGFSQGRLPSQTNAVATARLCTAASAGVTSMEKSARCSQNTSKIA